MPARSSATSQASSGGITIVLDDRSLERVERRLARYQGRPFQQRMEALVRLSLGAVARTMKQRAPVGRAHRGIYPRPGGLTQKSISVRKRRPPPGYFLQMGVKPRARHSHFASKGVGPHSLATRASVLAKGGSQYITFGGKVFDTRELTHPGSRPIHGRMRFIEETIASDEPKVLAFIRRHVTDEGVNVGALIGGAT